MGYSQVLQEVRLTAFRVLVNKGHEAAVMLLAPPVVAIVWLCVAWKNVAHFNPPAQGIESCGLTVVGDSMVSMLSLASLAKS